MESLCFDPLSPEGVECWGVQAPGQAAEEGILLFGGL